MRYFVASGNKAWGRWIEASTGLEARTVVSRVCPGTFPRDFISIPEKWMSMKELVWAKKLAARS
jgi:hypothetical protein